MQPRDLERVVGDLLRSRRLTLALAESCTGGLVADRVTNVPGSSDYFLGGVVSYSNEAKEKLLGVGRDTLQAHGAVSEPVAREMARGARRVFAASIALSVTGIAGPTGGTPDKPVGLTFVALSAADAEWCERHVWSGDRGDNKHQSAEAALAMLYHYLTRAPAGDAGFEPSLVEAQLDSKGFPTPRAFTWQGNVLAVRDVGRRWTETAGEASAWCVLVMTADQSVFELRLNPHDGRWLVRRISSHPAVV